MAARQWTAEQRQRQSELIRTWQPWKSSTGAKTAKGKAKVSFNGFGGHKRRLVLLQSYLARVVRNADKITPELIAAIKDRVDAV